MKRTSNFLLHEQNCYVPVLWKMFCNGATMVTSCDTNLFVLNAAVMVTYEKDSNYF